MEPDGASACVGDGEDGARNPGEPLPGRGRCLLGNWQEERATDHLDQVPSPARSGGGVTEGSFYRHGHRGLLTLQFRASLADRTTMKDSYQRPRRTGLPTRGQREAMMDWLLTQKYSKEVLEKEVHPPAPSTEPLSTTHQDYCWEGFLSVPPTPSKPHDYRLEQPQSYWLEQAQRPAVASSARTGDTAFKKCAAFTTPVPEYLDQLGNLAK